MHTLDKFLGGKVLLAQSEKGLRATSDSVLLAGAVCLKKNQTLLDVGAGNGVVGLCVNARIPCQLYALEIQDDLCAFIQKNARQNQTHINIIHQDIFHPVDQLKGHQFHAVVTNPPFYDSTGQGRKNGQQQTAYQAHFDLKKWLQYCLKHLKSGGTFTMIHRPEILGEILSVLSPKLGHIEIFPIQSKQKQPAKRIILRGILGSKSPLVLHSPLCMHQINGRRSQLAERILRLGQGF